MTMRTLILINCLASVALVTFGNRHHAAKFEPQATIESRPMQPLTRNQIISQSAKYWSEHYGVKVTPNMIRAKIWVESRGKVQAVSPKGAIGLMQLMPATARKVCGIGDRRLLANEKLNIDCGTQIYALHLSERNSEIKALVEYNGGFRCLKSRRCKESESHWKKVMQAKAKLDAGETLG